MNREKLEKKLHTKKMRTLKEELSFLVDRQSFLGEKREILWTSRVELREQLMTAIAAGDTGSREVLVSQLDVLRQELNDVNKEYRENSESIEAYSKEIKNRDEGGASIITAVGSIFAAAGGLFMAHKSLNMAHVLDTEGGLTNKRTFDIFNKIDVFRFFKKK